MNLALKICAIVLTCVAALSTAWFVALYLGGYPSVFQHERLGLIPLIAGLAASAITALRHRNLTGRQTSAALMLLVLWSLWLVRR